MKSHDQALLSSSTLNLNSDPLQTLYHFAAVKAIQVLHPSTLRMSMYAITTLELRVPSKTIIPVKNQNVTMIPQMSLVVSILGLLNHVAKAMAVLVH